MGIVYGAFLAFLLPQLARWWGEPTRLAAADAGVPAWLRTMLVLMAAGVFLSGLRDLAATRRRAAL
jgi:hypothetical protein